MICAGVSSLASCSFSMVWSRLFAMRSSRAVRVPSSAATFAGASAQTVASSTAPTRHGDGPDDSRRIGFRQQQGEHANLSLDRHDQPYADQRDAAHVRQAVVRVSWQTPLSCVSGARLSGSY